MKVTHLLRRPAVALLVLALSGCSVLSAEKPPASRSIEVVDTGNALTTPQLLSALEASDYVILGERHDNAEHHSYQLEALQALYQAGWLKQLSLEMLRPGQQAGMDKAYARKLTLSDELRETIGWDKNWNWDFYGPIVAWAIANEVPVRSANMDRDELMAIYREQVEPSRDIIDEAAIASIREQIRESHCGMADATMLDAMTRIQQARDTRMAESLVQREQGVVLLAGAFHARKDVGVPRYVHQLRPGARLSSVGFIEVVDDHLPDAKVQAHPYDIVWFTGAVDRKTPCELMNK